MSAFSGVVHDRLLDYETGPMGRVTKATTQVGADATVVELVIAARAGDRVAFTHLYGRFHAVVHAIVLARVSARDAGDVVQDCFADAWAKLHRIREPAAFPGWLLAIARHRAIDHARRARPITEIDDLATPAINQPPRVEAAAALRALRELPDTYRETMIMRLVEDLSGPEIAERTGMTPESVRVHLHRGMKLLRERLGGSP
jgi:RNA polymerase sigma-70 factor (ECF subfamily)